MNKPLAHPKVAPFLCLSLFLTVLLSACSKTKSVDSAPVPPAQYELKDIQYSVRQGDRVDTTTLQLKEISVSNASNTLSTQQVEERFGELVKTSRFTVDPATQLPKDVDLSTFAVSIPEHWYGNGLFDRSIETYPLSAVEEQKPYGFSPKGTLTVKIPAQSKIIISRQITAYQLTCSFDGILENTTTGQRYSLRGKWKGLLEYANPTTTLKQSAL